MLKKKIRTLLGIVLSVFCFCTRSYANDYEEKNLEKHNFEFNISLGFEGASIWYNTGLNAKIDTSRYRVLLYNPNNPDNYYHLPGVKRRAKKFSQSELMTNYAKNNISIFEAKNKNGDDMVLDTKESFNVSQRGFIIPFKFNFNYIFNRTFKIGLGGEINYPLFLSFHCKDLAKNNFNKGFEYHFGITESQNFFIDYRIYLNLGYKILDLDIDSFWLNLKGGMSWKFGNFYSNYLSQMFSGDYLYNGDFGYLGAMWKRYLAKNIKVFFALGLKFAVHKDEKPYGEDYDKSLFIYDFSFFNFDCGFSFGTNDGVYKNFVE